MLVVFVVVVVVVVEERCEFTKRFFMSTLVVEGDEFTFPMFIHFVSCFVLQKIIQN